MPKKVQRTKNSMNIGIAIFTAIATVIPVFIVACTGFSSFKTPYGTYALVTFGICIYFSCIFGMFAWKNKVLYIVMDVVNVAAALGLIIYAFINSYYQGGLLLHIAAAFLFVFGLYQSGDSDQGDSFFYRYVVPIALDVAGLIFVLWFIGVDMSVIAHIVIVSILDFLVLAIFLIPSLVKLFKNGGEVFDDICSDEVEYEEETEAEIAAKKESKMAKKEDKREKTAAKNQQASYEKARKKGLLKADGTLDTTRWYVWPNEINRILEKMTDEYNDAIETLNRQISYNNTQIRMGLDYKDMQEASKSNKQIGKATKYLKSGLKRIRKNLDKLRQKEFTAQDKYKAFKYYVIAGKFKHKKSDQEEPTLQILDCRVYYHYNASLRFGFSVEMKYEGEEDVYLKKR